MEELTHKSIVASYEMYDITDGNEILLEATNEAQPLRFITDFGMMPIEALENKLKTLSTNESFELTVAPAEAFGEYITERVLDLDKQIFCINGVFDEVNIVPGAIIPLQNEENQRFMAQVVAIKEDKVKVDLNHPLAGKTLKFKGTVIESHDASQEEIMALMNQMNNHSCGGSCSGGCGSCGNGGCGSCGDDGCGSCDEGGCSCGN